ncbi:MAG: cell division protein ZapA [Acutalibacteraceae bacterium]
MIEKTRVKLKIVGSEFVVSADEDKDYIVKISSKVDRRIKEILRENDSMTVAMAAILAALNYCDELEKEKIITEELLKRTETSEAIAGKVSSELEYLRTENKQLREEKLGLHKVIEELQSSADTDEKPQSEAVEESPQQLRIPLPDADGKIQTPQEEAVPIEPQKQEQATASEQPEAAQTAQPEQPKQPEEPVAQPQAEPQKPTEPVAQPQQAQPKPQPQEKKPVLTAREMLEEKKKALLAQKNAAGAKNQSRPKPFRPVPSAKSGGGAFPGNSKIDPKINYRDNDKISDSFRRKDFAEIPSEEDMLSFFDRR